MLEVEKVTKRFGGVTALDGVFLDVEEGTVSGLIGPNGAGKTVLFNVITGHYRPEEGSVYFREEEITTQPTWKRARLGIARGFQQLRIFRDQTVLENLVMAARSKQIRHNVMSVAASREYEELEDRALDILTEIELAEMSHALAGELSFGQQKLVQFGILLMLDPDLIMLDEIMAGVNPKLSDRMKEYIRDYNDRGTTFFIVEHDVPSIMELCDKVTVLNNGQRIADAPPASIRENEKVIDAYLG